VLPVPRRRRRLRSTLRRRRGGPGPTPVAAARAPRARAPRPPPRSDLVERECRCAYLFPSHEYAAACGILKEPLLHSFRYRFAPRAATPVRSPDVGAHETFQDTDSRRRSKSSATSGGDARARGRWRPRFQAERFVEQVGLRVLPDGFAAARAVPLRRGLRPTRCGDAAERAKGSGGVACLGAEG